MEIIKWTQVKTDMEVVHWVLLGILKVKGPL
jgi:hypothetical protein